ncbi:porin [Mesorhizobium xinjiangense]|uniref:porin n=1 Tax=Mesorhizobium xinjiangense TaxID=2678685 RepID=UPI0018DE2B6A|nr:porin [Mesorhizobium xinjiangense]
MIAEPEPVEYVRVCDVFGTGFFYIPGTETCLRFDGYVRYRVGASEDADGWFKRTRVRLNVDTRSETELGTLRGFMRFQADWGNGDTGSNGTITNDGDVGIDQAIVQLGGFYAGYTESAFAAPWGLPGPARFGILHTDQGGMYADQQRHQLGYIFNGGNGFFGSIALEDDNHLGDTVLPPEFRNIGESDGYMPDVVGTAGLNQAWGAVWGGVGYDESASEFGARAGLQWNVPNAPGSSLRLGGWYASDPNAYAVEMPINGLAEWSLAASYHHQFNPQWGAEIGAQYMQSFDDPAFGDDSDGYQIEAAAIWQPVANFDIRLEGHYYNQDGATGEDDTWDGFLWFRRSF